MKGPTPANTVKAAVTAVITLLIIINAALLLMVTQPKEPEVVILPIPTEPDITAPCWECLRTQEKTA